MRSIIMSLLFSLLLTVSACSKEPTPNRAEPSNQAAPVSTTGAGATQHAPADVKPGSHEDWCVEHQVPESMCTRCNPSLVAAFKATGDWCEEHGLPESQCLKCNPNLKIVRPPKEQ